MNAIKIEINLDALGYMTVGGLKEHLSRVENSEKILKDHIAQVKGRIFRLNVSEYEAKWPFKEGQLVEVTYRLYDGVRTHDEIGYFLRFGKASSYYSYGGDEVYLVLNNIKKDATIGKRTMDILAKDIVSIEPYEIPYVNKK